MYVLQLQNAFPRELLETAVASDCFGGGSAFRRMNILERFIVKKMAKTEQDTAALAEERIQQFAQAINDAQSSSQKQ